MEHREDRVDDALRPVRDVGDPRARLRGVRDEVAVRQRRTLRIAGRAARVLEQRDIVEAWPGHVVKDPVVSEELLPRHRPGHRRRERGPRLPRLADREPQHRAHPPRHRVRHVDGDDRRLDVLWEVLDGLDDFVPRDRELRPVVLELVAQLARRVERVVLDDDRAKTQDRVERGDVLRAVREHDRDRVARADAELSEPLGGAIDLLAQLRVGRLGAEELECDVRVAVARDRIVDEVRERRPRLLDLGRNSRRVVADPGPRRHVLRHGNHHTRAHFPRQMGAPAHPSAHTAPISARASERGSGLGGEEDE